MAQPSKDEQPHQTPALSEEEDLIVSDEELPLIINHFRNEIERIIPLIGHGSAREFLEAARILEEAERTGKDIETIRTLVKMKVRDVQRLMRASRNIAKLWNEAHTDALTQLPNKRRLEREGKKVFEFSRKWNLPLSCLFIDLDYFKAVNDSRGQAGGDAVLQEFAKMIAQTFRESDAAFGGPENPLNALSHVVGREGGEEFVVVMPNTNLQQAAIAAERLRQRLQDTPINGLNLTCTIGVAQADYKKDPDLSSLKNRANEGKMAGKETHRNIVTLAKSTDSETVFEHLETQGRRQIPKLER